jgi:hypothetical protein
MNVDSYAPNLSAQALDQAVSELLATKRRCQWLLCRYLADLSDDDRYRELGWCSSILHYARARHGLGAKATRERVRIGRALRGLPAIEQAFVCGQLSYSRVRELSRVATGADEHDWLDAASMMSMSELERAVAGNVGAEAKAAARPATARWRTPETVELRAELPAEAWALLSRAMQGARLASAGPMSDAEALAAVAREALAGQSAATEGAAEDASSAADPRKAVVLYSCRRCARTELETNAGAVELSEAAASRLGCGARLVDLAEEGWQVGSGGVIGAAVRRAVLARDRGCCRVPGCGRRRYVDVHHIEPQSRGGVHSRGNCLCLCTTCHAAIHAGKLRVQGDAERGVRFFDVDGRELGCSHSEPRREAAATAAPEHEPEPELSTAAQSILRAMGRRGGWTLDALCDVTALAAGKVSVALTELELNGNVALLVDAGCWQPLAARLGCDAERDTDGDAPAGASIWAAAPQPASAPGMVAAPS